MPIRQRFAFLEPLAKERVGLKHDPVSDVVPRSGFKTSDRVQGQGAGRSITRSIHWVCEHLSEACDAPQCNRIGANPASRGNAAIGAS
jgi:hypothetical protein